MNTPALSLLLFFAPPNAEDEPSAEVAESADQELDRAAPIMPAADVRRINEKWTGVGLGYDNGFWGSQFGQGLKLNIPFGRKLGRYMGLRARGIFVHTVDDVTDVFDPVVNVGAELYGRGPVWGGLVRVYGGGGPYVGIRPNPTDRGGQVTVGGGGHFGVEFVAARFMSFTFEVGGQAPGHANGLDGGASVMGGVMFWFGRTTEQRKRR